MHGILLSMHEPCGVCQYQGHGRSITLMLSRSTHTQLPSHALLMVPSSSVAHAPGTALKSDCCTGLWMRLRSLEASVKPTWC